MSNFINRVTYFGYRLQSVENRLSELEKFNAANLSNPTKSVVLDLPKTPLVGTWERLDHFANYHRARALLSIENLYVGFDAGRRGMGSLMRYDGDWHELFSHQGITEIVTLCRHKDEIWFGATSLRDGASVWRGDGQHFEKVGQWPKFFSVASLASFDGKLFCSLVPFEKSDTAAPVFVFDGQWNDVLNDHPYQCIYDLHPHKKQLYGGTIGAGWFGGHVIDILSGRIIGGDGNNGSWNHQSTMLRLCSFGDTLIATGNREPAVTGNHSSIWAYAEKAWKPIPLPPPGFQELYSFNAVHPFKDHLIIGCGGRPAGQAAILCLSKDGWSQIGGTGLNNSWSPNVYRRMNAPLASGSQSDYVYNFCEHDGRLIAGFGASPGCGQVWRFVPDSTAPTRSS